MMKKTGMFLAAISAGLVMAASLPMPVFAMDEIAEEESEWDLMDEGDDPFADGEMVSEIEEEGRTGSKKSKKKKEEPTVDSGGLIIDDGARSDSIAGDPVFSLEELWEDEYWFPGFEVDPNKYPAANINVNTITVYRFLTGEMELNHAAACGVLANVQVESNFRPLALGDGGTSYGICQWHNGRFTHLMNYCKSRSLDYNTLEGQLSFLGYELTHGYRAVYAALLETADNAQGAYEAGYLFCYHFEKPDQIEARSMRRGNLAKAEYYDKDFDQLDWDLINRDLLLQQDWLKILEESYGPLWEEDFRQEDDMRADYEDLVLPEWNTVLGEPAQPVETETEETAVTPAPLQP